MIVSTVAMNKELQSPFITESWMDENLVVEKGGNGHKHLNLGSYATDFIKFIFLNANEAWGKIQFILEPSAH